MTCENEYNNGGSESVFLLNIPLQRDNLISCSFWKNLTNLPCLYPSQMNKNLLSVSLVYTAEELKKKKKNWHVCTNWHDDT